MDRGWIRKNMGVVGEKTYLELNSVSCLDLDLVPSDKQSCCVSRSFSQPIEQLFDLEESNINLWIQEYQEKSKGRRG